MWNALRNLLGGGDSWQTAPGQGAGSRRSRPADELDSLEPIEQTRWLGQRTAGTDSNPMNNALPGTPPFEAKEPVTGHRMTVERIAHLASRGYYDLVEPDGSIASAMHPVRVGGGIVGKRAMDVDDMGRFTKEKSMVETDDHDRPCQSDRLA